MRINSRTNIILLASLAVTAAHAGDSTMLRVKSETKPIFPLNPTIDKSLSGGLYIPHDLKGSVAELKKMLPQSALEDMRECNESEMQSYNLSLGPWMRSNWQLWSRTALTSKFHGEYPATISGTIIEALWLDLHNRPYDYDNSRERFEQVAPRASTAIDKNEAVSSDHMQAYFIDKQGHLVGSGYDKLLEFSNGVAAVRRDNKWGFIKQDGSTLVPPKYDDARPFSDGMAAVRSGNRVGFVDLSGKLVIPCHFENVGDFKESLAPVKIANKWGYINKSGTIVISCKWDSAENFSEGIAVVESMHRYNYIDKSGNNTNQHTFLKAFPYRNGFGGVYLTPQMKQQYDSENSSTSKGANSK